MLPRRTSTSMAERKPRLRPGLDYSHSDMLKNFLPRFTSAAMARDSGGSYAYQGHSVRFEWQSLHARSKTRATATGIPAGETAGPAL